MSSQVPIPMTCLTPYLTWPMSCLWNSLICPLWHYCYFHSHVPLCHCQVQEFLLSGTLHAPWVISSTHMASVCRYCLYIWPESRPYVAETKIKLSLGCSSGSSNSKLNSWEFPSWLSGNNNFVWLNVTEHSSLCEGVTSLRKLFWPQASVAKYHLLWQLVLSYIRVGGSSWGVIFVPR